MFVITIEQCFSMKDTVINELVINCIVASNLYEML